MPREESRQCAGMDRCTCRERRAWSAGANFSFKIAKRMSPPPQGSRVRPAALRQGDTIGIVAPASNLKREILEAGCDRLRGMGYKPFYFDSILESDLYFAGSVKRRAQELE